MPTEELKSLVKARGTIKNKLTTFGKFINKIPVLLKDADEQETQRVFIELNLRFCKSEKLLEEFNMLQEKIEILHEDLDEQAIESETFENIYYELITKAKILIESSNNHDSQDNESDHDSSVQASTDSVAATTNAVQPQISLLQTPADSVAAVTNVKLPQISLSKFNGHPEKWVEFRDMFNSLINDNNELSQVQKFHYLRASLEGDASEVIKAMELSNSNYILAWDLLCERFDNKRLLIHNHVKSLFNMQIIKHDSSIEFRKMSDNLSKHVRALQSLEQPTQHWDTLLIHIVSSKFNSSTLKEWEQYQSKLKLANLDNLKAFLKQRAELFENIEIRSIEKSKTSRSFLVTNNQCSYCQNDHVIYSCKEFLKLSIENRIKHIKDSKSCINCLRQGHFANECKSGPCRKCKLYHNTLLHLEFQTSLTATESQQDAPCFSNQNVEILLSTAIVKVMDVNGILHKCRILLDSGSQSNFISEGLCKRLKLPLLHSNTTIVGIGQNKTDTTKLCKVSLSSNVTSFSINVDCLVIPRISGNIPSGTVNISGLKIPNHLPMADPGFNEPRQIDLLLGASVFWNIITIGQISLGKKGPFMQKTKFGWVVSGQIHTQSASSQTFCSISSLDNIENELLKFWEIEGTTFNEGGLRKLDKAEQHFTKTFQRNTDGRFVVSTPFKESPSSLGESKTRALKRFYNMERKLIADPKLRSMYVNFMEEYISLGHMSQVNNEAHGQEYYLPHHGVLKETSKTTKLRVVFDGSAITSAGNSINSIQRVGPTIQQDLFRILMRFRKHTYVVSADICKMYRQVLLNPTDRPLHKIFWRSNQNSKLETYELNTVTYGTASASFLAIRSLIQLAIEHEGTSPVASEVIKSDFYVDDLLTGSDSKQQLSELCQQVSEILNSGCFQLTQWASNSNEVLNNIKKKDANTSIIDFSSNEPNKILGLIWYPYNDIFQYKVHLNEASRVTKRVILSEIAQIFDPLGLLSPIIIIPKIIMQELWSLKLSWDETIPPQLHLKWSTLKGELSQISDLRIPRHVLPGDPSIVELHGFCDASQQAYGACLYLKGINDTNTTINLLCAKSKVAPLKPSTIPRLELSGALVLAKLVAQARKALAIPFSKIYLWSDSTIVLAWIQTNPNLLQTFVANRVAEIQELASDACWKHVPTHSNPADLLSRGLYPEQLRQSNLWWHGPEWLKQPAEEIPDIARPDVPLLELKNTSITFLAINDESIIEFQRFSKLSRLKRAFAYSLRFIFNARRQYNDRILGDLTLDEIEASYAQLIKHAQRESFVDVSETGINKRKELSKLAPFIDKGTIRVGGRLQNSEFSYNKKHPMLMNAKHHLTKLIFEDQHSKLLHCGPQALLATIRNEIWPIGGRNLARTVTNSCVTCRRYNAKKFTPIMGQLPQLRTNPAPPFHNTGIDYAGPISLKNKRGRGSKNSKAYIAVFVCLVTKAIHLELISDLTSAAFVACFKRFISRRGKPSHVYSDNGTNFVGAQSDLSKFLKTCNEDLTAKFDQESVRWHFIPPRSPHFGGIWEAGVRSIKHHMKRVLGDTAMIYEDMCTLLCQIECVLNSRPLCPLSCNPNDLEALTPAHFLIGRPLVALPEHDLTSIKVNRLNHFQFMQQKVQHFWDRWSKEYINELQVRSKWKTSVIKDINNMLVLIKEDNMPPSKWVLGRIIMEHPGKDGVTRVVTVKTGTGVLKRAVHKLAPIFPEGEY